MKGTIVIAGSVAQRPHHGGHAWVFLQYLLGFRRLGFNVLFLDDLPASATFDDAGRPCDFASSSNVRVFTRLMRRFGLEHSFSLTFDGGKDGIGLSREQVHSRLRESRMLINVMGFLTDPELLAAAPLKVFLDIDPGFGQMWRKLGLHDCFARHDRFVTIGLNVGSPECEVPICGLDWITTPQPIVLAHWPVSPISPPLPPEKALRFTSIASWRGPFGPIEFNGRTYGLRVHEFRKFITLPHLSGQTFELALDIDPVETRDLALLDANNWRRVDPRKAAGDPWSYRDYVAGSDAELVIAKNLYVQTRGGWFSDRSICYLASGKPVLAQDTGLANHLPSGKGLLLFTTMEEALAGIGSIQKDYPAHCTAARRIAQECFDSDRVLSRLLSHLNIN